MINNNKANIATEQTLVLSVIFCLFSDVLAAVR
jgi:hypothetical protein